jgi:general secretion pathway protein A
MYLSFFGLRQAPFSIAPDPRYLYMSERHREALAHLLYGLDSGGGFVVLTGEIGAGKTTVCRCFLEQVPDNCDVAYIVNPKVTVIELLRSVCDELGIEVTPSTPPTVKDHVDPLNRFLLAAHAAGRHCVLVIDEAQNLSADVLEQLRLLTNLETDERKLLQILLIGQPELRALLARPDLEQLAQRVIARYHLDAMNEAETLAYVAHRLAVAGLGGPSPFDRAALRRVHQLSRGVPRRINLLCDRALLGAYAEGQARIGARIVERAAREVFDREPAKSRRRGYAGAIVAAGATGALAMAVGLRVIDLGAFGPGARRAAVSTAAASVPEARASGQGSPAASAAAAAASALPAAQLAAAPASGAASAVDGATEPEPPAVDPAVILAELPRDSRRAWRELALDWGWTSAGSEPCAEAPAQHLQCLRSANATLALLRLLDRPGLLALQDGDAAPRQARLVGLGERHVVLASGRQRWVVAQDELARLWHGGFATFWRAPQGYVSPLAAGARGPAVDSLAAGLARLHDEPPPAPGQALAGSLLARLAAFQLAQGLQPDGVAGPTTFIRLNRALGVDEPRLATP